MHEHLLLVVAVMLAAAFAAHAAEVFRAPKFDAGPAEWTIASAGDKKANADCLDGALVTNGPRWQSPIFPVQPLEFYRIRFKAKGAGPGLWAAIFFDEKGRQLQADHYSGFDGSDGWKEHEYFFHARTDARTAQLWFHPWHSPQDTVQIKSAVVETAERKDVARWADRVYKTIPALEWQAPKERLAKIPKTIEALKAGKSLRVVMLGDSIINDTGNSTWNVLVERMYPGARIDVITSVRGGTGCQYYQNENRVEEYVLRHQPDLLIIGGISNNFDVAAIQSVIQQVRAKISPEILILTDPVGIQGDPRMWPEWMVKPGKPGLEARTYLKAVGEYRVGLKKLAEEEGCEFLDIGTAWQTYISHSGRPYEFFLRDPVHCNHRGRQVLARVIERFFEPRD